MEKFTNDLIKESSPYLLQHAHNPVDWHAWSPDIFERAKKENKMVLISVGYSACHWCHVMEHESFEDEEVAQLMNELFINVKVDREERPDVDNLYMNAVQLMTQRGGWPLNCFTLPDGRPIYGGTYFPKEQWMNILRSLKHTFENDLPKVIEYAEKLHEGIKNSDLIQKNESEQAFGMDKLEELVLRWKKSFDRSEGGTSRAPKFPLPNNYSFLLDYGNSKNDEELQAYVGLTLDKMALGGLYDQVGGGFTRYSVDMLWKVPHFEKMLYDNAQLLALYSKGYEAFQRPLYKRIVEQTINWLNREMADTEGAFFAALDADSEGEEGKYYCWTESELEKVLGKDFGWVSLLYSVNQRGYWEDGKYILLRTMDDNSFCKQMGWTMDFLEKEILRINDLLLNKRKERTPPGLDDKLLTSWNAMLITGLCKAYEVFQEDEYLHMALKIGRWIKKHQFSLDGKLYRTRKGGVSRIDGFLEDYAHVIEAFLALHQITLDHEWLEKSFAMTNFVLKNFQDKESKMFYFSEENTELIARKMEFNDNVIPSSNSVMATNLFKLGTLFSKREWIEDSKQMLRNVYDGMEMYGSGYSNWASLLLNNIEPFYLVVCSGKQMSTELLSLGSKVNYLIVNENSNELEVVKEKQGTTGYYHVCYDGTCLLPTTDIEKVREIVMK